MQASVAVDVRVAARLDAADALAWVELGPGGCVSLVVTRARGAAVQCTPRPDARERLERAAAHAAAAGATRILAWQAEGTVREGAVVAIVAAQAEHRREAVAATQLLLAGFKGVAERQDLFLPPG